MQNEIIIVLDFGGQYSRLITRSIREANVYCEILPYNVSIQRIRDRNPNGIIFTGGPSSVNEDGSPECCREVYELGVPILGICYGAQLISKHYEGTVVKSPRREYGKSRVRFDTNSVLFQGLEYEGDCWMSHTDYVQHLPEGFIVTASSENCPVAAIENKEGNLFGVQFHPEVVHTPQGKKILENFIYKICGCTGQWTMSNFVRDSIKTVNKRIGKKRVLCALSGGVDSSVAAVMVHKAVGKQLTCIFVDHGLLRKDEAYDVEKVFREQFDINLICVNAQERFLSRLKGITDPETKRKLIGEEFIRTFEEEAKKIGEIDFLVQGTIYPDVIESGIGDAALIKSHHNVGGLPEHVDFKEIIEPLRDLFKDEVRKAGEELGMPHSIVWRQPFPGPGLAIRTIGEVNKFKLDILRNADAVLREEICNWGLDKEIWQYFAVITDMKSVGVMGDIRTYDYTIVLRAITSTDGMTADWARIPHEILGKISNRIVNEVNYVNRVVYDITSKPPATIEWE